MTPDMPGKVPPTPRSEEAKPLQEQSEQGQAPTGEPFESYMQKEGAAPTEGGQPSPFDLPQGASRGGVTTQPTMDSVVGQMNVAGDHLDNIQKALGDKNLKLKQSQKYLLRNKLGEANSQIRSAATAAGVDVGEAPQTTSRMKPIAKYIAMVSDSQQQINEASQQIKAVSAKGGTMQPAQLLQIQSKMQKASTELEYTSVLLSTVTQDVKTIFQIQI